MTSSEEKLYNIKNQLDKLKYEKEQTQEERLQELLESYVKTLQNEQIQQQPSLIKMTLSSFVTEIKNLYY